MKADKGNIVMFEPIRWDIIIIS